MRAMCAIDLKIISFVESIARWLQYWTGKNCFFWAKVCSVLMLMGLIHNIAAHYEVWFNGCLAAFFLVSWHWDAARWDVYARDMAEGEFSNPLKHSLFLVWLRTLFYYLAFISLFISLHAICSERPLPFTLGTY